MATCIVLWHTPGQQRFFNFPWQLLGLESQAEPLDREHSFPQERREKEGKEVSPPLFTEKATNFKWVNTVVRGRESYSQGQGLMRMELLGHAAQSKQNKLGEGEEPALCGGWTHKPAWAWLFPGQLPSWAQALD